MDRIWANPGRQHKWRSQSWGCALCNRELLNGQTWRLSESCRVKSRRATGWPPALRKRNPGGEAGHVQNSIASRPAEGSRGANLWACRVIVAVRRIGVFHDPQGTSTLYWIYRWSEAGKRAPGRQRSSHPEGDWGMRSVALSSHGYTDVSSHPVNTLIPLFLIPRDKVSNCSCCP